MGKRHVEFAFPFQNTLGAEYAIHMLLHGRILAEQGLAVTVADFLQWQTEKAPDRIVMNPPFSEGRWQAHLEHALDMLAPAGRLVAILPSGAASSAKLAPGFKADWLGPYCDKFKGASVDVVILVADKS